MLIHDWDEWSLVSAIPPILAIAVATAWSLYILAYPPVYKKLSIALLGIPAAYAFIHHEAIAPDFTLSDTIGRFMYIWYAHMSYEVIILEFQPTADKENLGWKSKLNQAYRVIWDRNHAPFLKDKALLQEKTRRASLQDDQGVQETIVTNTTTTTTTTTSSSSRRGKETNHGYSYARFTLHHALQFILLMVSITLNDLFRNSYYGPSLSFTFDASPSSFFRRLPASLDREELYYRAQCCWDWTVISLFEYELYYSLCALVFVSILRWDAPSEWPLSLCGHLSEAWSVRQYWGRHWHNYIYHSFTAHTRIVTRSWMGLARGHLTTRLLENTIVFAVSGFMHTVVRWVQSPGGNHWPITLWYIAQMLPIVLESMAQHYWRMARKRLNLQKHAKWLGALELAVGYVWVAGWFMWSVPKYNAAGAEWRMVNIEYEMGQGVGAARNG